MTNQNIQLEIGDEIGFVILAGDIDSTDETIWFPVVEITTKEGERAYRYMYPDGEVSRSAIKQSELKYKSLRIHSQAVVAAALQPNKAEMICVNDRTKEHLEALARGENSKLEVFNDWDRNSFAVKNHTTRKEYNVNFLCEGKQVFASCECADFTYRHRVCKHISAVLHDALLGMFAKN
jgi:hypothetical protein